MLVVAKAMSDQNKWPKGDFEELRTANEGEKDRRAVLILSVAGEDPNLVPQTLTKLKERGLMDASELKKRLDHAKLGFSDIEKSHRPKTETITESISQDPVDKND
jgi:hypothetical protein